MLSRRSIRRIRSRKFAGFRSSADAAPCAETACTTRARCAQQVLQSEGVDFDTFIDVTIVDGQTIRQMNAEYRGKDTVTDVLSFPMYEFWNGVPQEELEYDPEIDKVMLGDMILNYDRAVEQAADFGHSPERECGFLTVHSVLHLLGYDHERDEADRKRMRGKEEDNLTALGLVRA